MLIRNVGMNPLRAGLIEILQKMGGKITIDNKRGEDGEPLADLRVEASELHGINVPASHAPSMIDEYPYWQLSRPAQKEQPIWKAWPSCGLKKATA